MSKQRQKADVVLAIRGNRPAFERLYREHVARVHSLSLWFLENSADAEDATQEIFVRAWGKLDTFRHESAFGTWLRRLAVNFLLRRRKKLRKHTEVNVDQVSHMLDETHMTEDTPADRALFTTQLEKAVAGLSEELRPVFVLHDVEGYTHSEIGSLLGIRMGTSASRLHRARARLRDVLEPVREEKE